MSSFWFRNHVSLPNRRYQKRADQRCRRPAFRPWIETLEDRLTPSAPTVTSPTIAGLNAHTVLLGGNVTANGGDNLINRGIVYSKTSENDNPTLGGVGVKQLNTIPPFNLGVFTVDVSPLVAGTGYSFKAFAINQPGDVGYSDVQTFTTTTDVLMPTPTIPVTTPPTDYATLNTLLWFGPSSSDGTGNLPKLPVKTISFTNNSSQTVYPFLRGLNSTLTPNMSPDTALYDPIDKFNEEYREYVGYKLGGVNYLGLPAGMTTTISVPLVFWDGGRIEIASDGTYILSNATDGTNPNGLPNPDEYQAYQKDGTQTPSAILPAVSASGGPAGATGLLMFYHSKTPIGPVNEAPGQLLEYTIRDPWLANLSTGSKIAAGEKQGLINYDVSYVDSMMLPVAMEAIDVPVPIPNGYPQTTNDSTKPPIGPIMPFGWIGSASTVEQFQAALKSLTDTNTGDVDLGKYFGLVDANKPALGYNGWPQYNINIPLKNGSPAFPEGFTQVKLPSGQSAFGDSPLGQVPDNYNSTFYALTSGGQGPFQVDGGINGTSDGNGTITFSAPTDPKNKTVQVGMVISSADVAVPPNTKVATLITDGMGNVTGITTSGPPFIAAVSGKTFAFMRNPSDYAAEAIMNLWYTWANYYVTNNGGTAQSLQGFTHDNNKLTLINVPTGLVPGMAIGPAGSNGIAPVAGNGITRILGFDPDDATGKTLLMSQLVGSSGSAGSPNSYDFSLPTMDSLQGWNNDPKGFKPTLLTNPAFDPTQGVNPLAVPVIKDFAANIYQVMSFMSSIAADPKKTTPYAIQLMFNVIGGNIGKVPNIGNVPPGTNPNPAKTLFEVPIRDKIKSLLRGVTDFTKPNSSMANPANWYPPPKDHTGGQEFNVYNLDPFVWLVHQKLGLSGYGFSLDDDVADIGAGWANKLAVAIGGLNGLPNQTEWTPGAPYGPISAQITADSTVVYPPFFKDPKIDPPNNERLYIKKVDPVVSNLPKPLELVNYYAVKPDAPLEGQAGARVLGPNVPASTSLLHYGIDLAKRDYFLNKQLGYPPFETGKEYTFTFVGMGTANASSITLSTATNATDPYVNTASLKVATQGSLTVTGTVAANASYTQQFQQNMYLAKDPNPLPELRTIVNGTLTAARVNIVNGFLVGVGTVAGSVNVSGPLSATTNIYDGLFSFSGGGQKATEGGFLQPGKEDGTPGQLTVTGDVRMYGATFVTLARGASNGSYSVLAGQGTVNLGNSKLNVSLNYAPKANDTLKIITAAKPVAGFFTRADGTVIKDGDIINVKFNKVNYNFKVRYNLQGNNVVLKASQPEAEEFRSASSEVGSEGGTVQPKARIAYLPQIPVGQVKALKEPSYSVEKYAFRYDGSLKKENEAIKKLLPDTITPLAQRVLKRTDELASAGDWFFANLTLGQDTAKD